MQDRTMTLYQEDGTKVICDILFTYHYEKTNKDYVVFQVRDTNEVSAATYEPTDSGAGRLGLVETEEEWTMLEGLLNDYAQSLDDLEGSCGGACGSCGGCGGACDGDCDCDSDCCEK